MVHKTAYALAALVPVAIFVSPSPLTTPVDIALGIAIPLHAHVGCNGIISDYVPQVVSARFVIFLLPTVFPSFIYIAAFGLLSYCIFILYLLLFGYEQMVRPAARGALLGLTGLSLVGLLRLNLEGKGITESVKSLWHGK